MCDWWLTLNHATEWEGAVPPATYSTRYNGGDLEKWKFKMAAYFYCKVETIEDILTNLEKTDEKAESLDLGHLVVWIGTE